MNKFEVISEFSPKGDQPNAIKKLKNGISSGKSTTIEYLRKKGFQTLDLDKISNEIINSNESIKFLDTNFPGVIKNQKLVILKKYS